MEVLWKRVTGILNRCLMSVIQFHDTLHGLRMGRETKNTSLEAKLLQHIMDMRKEVLKDIFLYLCKLYDTPDCLDIIAA